MAKINRFIVEYANAVKLSGVTPDMDKPPKAVIRRFVRLFQKVEDARVDSMTDYPLVEIILISFLAILANASTWEEIAEFGRSKRIWLKKFVRLKNGVPSHDTFRRVFSLIDTDTLQAATVDFLAENISSIRRSLGLPCDGYRHICIDGKEENGTGRKYGSDEEVRNLQTLHVYDATNSICLCSKHIDSKTNEIPVAQEILPTLELKGSVVTFDALHTQKDTVRIIAEGKGDYVGGLKGNQSGLLEAVTSYFTDALKEKIQKNGSAYYETIEKAHNKAETRRFYLAPAKFGKDEWKGLKSFLLYEKRTLDVVTGAESLELRYYITSLTDVELAADAVRGHWEIEVKLHWHLDHSFGEDDNTTMDKTAFQNYSLMNKLALTLCKLAQPFMNNCSIRVIRKKFSWNLEECLAFLLNAFDDESIVNALESINQKSK